VLDPSTWLDREAVAVVNPDGRGPFVLVCDHASNWVPGPLKALGLHPGELERHIAWDPGALELARRLSPYHQALANVIERSAARNAALRVVSIHSFTPVYRKERRPWHIGVLSGADRRLSQPLLELLRASGEFHVGDNQPYAPTDGVYHTLHRHTCARKLRSVLLELRADLIADDESRHQWALRLTDALLGIH
jgi:predicted N-formylglutamate amidohydrolase